MNAKLNVLLRATLQSFYLTLRHRSRKLRVGILSTFENVTFGDYNTVYILARLRDVQLGSFSYVANGARITHASIGKFCSIGPNAKIGVGAHPSREFVSTHPAFYSPKLEAGLSFVETSRYEDFRRITIGNDVWIGESAIILDGVIIGDGAIVAAGAVVTRDVPPYAVAAGIPAKTIRYRFSPADIAALETIQWWDRDVDWLKAHADSFLNVSLLVGRMASNT
jgi:acetyltransferase-like isoleucine patch superfamily enzyme